MRACECRQDEYYFDMYVSLPRRLQLMQVFPEMRAALRTYHPIPSLQAGRHESNAKHLQDSPRIKSILKGVQDLRPEPLLYDTLIAAQQSGNFPSGSPISILFVFANYCTRFGEKHFEKTHVFYDIFNGTQYTPQSRATALLWLLYHYLETDGSVEAAQHNPFGRPGDGNFHIPPFVLATEEEQEAMDKDTEIELAYAERMVRERQLYLEKVQVLNPNQNPRKRAPNIAKKEWTEKHGTPSAVDDAVEVAGDQQQEDSQAGSIGYLLNEPVKEPASESPGVRHSTRPRKQRITEGYDHLSDEEGRDENNTHGHAAVGHHTNSVISREIKKRFKKQMKHLRRLRRGRTALQYEYDTFDIEKHFPDGLDHLDGEEGAEYANALLTAIRRASRRAMKRHADEFIESSVRRNIIGGGV